MIEKKEEKVIPEKAVSPDMAKNEKPEISKACRCKTSSSKTTVTRATTTKPAAAKTVANKVNC